MEVIHVSANNDHDYCISNDKSCQNNLGSEVNATNLYSVNDIEPYIVYVDSSPGSGKIGNLHPLAMGKTFLLAILLGYLKSNGPIKHRIVSSFKTASTSQTTPNRL